MIDYIRVVEWCAKECYRQRVGPHRVASMFNAWQWAQDEKSYRRQPVVDSIIKLGKLVEPIKNVTGIRFVNLSFPPDTPSGGLPVQFALQELCAKTWATGSGDKFAYEFLRVHPFVDGNGRTAAILYNWVNGTLEAPVDMPDFFNEPHRHEVPDV